MNTLAEQPLSTWIKQIPDDLFKLDETPLLGYPPAFPLGAFIKYLETSLQIEGLDLTAAEWQWRSKEELFAGFGDSFKSVALTFVPLTGPLFWVMTTQEISLLMERLLLKQAATQAISIDTDFLEGFYKFLTLEILAAVKASGFDKQLSLNLSEETSLPTEHCLSVDVAISLQNLKLNGRLLLSPEFRSSWAQHYKQLQSDAILKSPLAETLDVIICLEAGKVNLKPSEWKQVSLGDCILLDSCSLNPELDKGRVQLAINGIPFFRGKIKQGSIKILEHPLYHEVDTTMPNPSDKQNEENEDEILDDSDLDTELDSEFEDDSELDSDFDLDSEIESEIETESELEDDSEEEEEEEASVKDSEESKTVEDLKPVTAGPSISIEDLPLNIIIEVGRLQMSIKKLLELQPGNMLDLNVHSNASVNLVVNGKRIAKGELLRIGEALGVRVTELT